MGKTIITDSQNGPGLKELQRGHIPQPPCSSRAIPEHMKKDFFQTLLEYLQ